MINGLNGRTPLEVEEQVRRGAKFVVFPWTVSVLILTLKRTSSVHYVAPDESAVAKGLPCILVTLLFGWWGIPWGPIYSVMSIVEILGGGIDVTRTIVGSDAFTHAAILEEEHEKVKEKVLSVQEFARATVRLLALALASEGYTGNEEMLFVSRTCWEIFGDVLPVDELERIIRLESKEPNWAMAMPSVCRSLRQVSNLHERRMVLTILGKLLFVDGKVTKSEKKYFKTVGAELGLDWDDVKLVYETQKNEFLSSESGGDVRCGRALRILGLKKDATDEDVKARYKKLALKYHPDRVRHLGSKVQDEALVKFKKITDARDTLLN